MDDERGDHSDLEVTRLDAPAGAAYHPGRLARWLRGLPGRLTLSALCLALVASALVALLARGGVDAAPGWGPLFGLATATPSGPIPPGGDTFIVEDSVPWGALTVDGQRPQLIDQSGLGSGFTLARGVHHLMYQARYFHTLRCVISVPQSAMDTCPLANESDLGGITYQRFLDMLAVPEEMDGNEQDALNLAIARTLGSLTASATIATGDSYINQHGAIVTASAPLTFTVSVAADQPLLACPRLCVDPKAPESLSPYWILNEDVHPIFVVSDARGNGFTSPATLGLNTESTVTFNVSLSSSGWDARLDQPQATLDSIVQGVALAAVLAIEPGPAPNAGQGAAQGTGVTTAVNPANGAIAIFPNAAGANGYELLLWRFGLLYTTDTTTATMFPFLPLASPTDVTLAHAIYDGEGA